MDWHRMGGHHGSWGGYGMMMPGHMPWGMGMGGMGAKMTIMCCPVCGEPLLKPTNEELVELLERKKKRLQAAVEHIDKEIERLKTTQM